MKKALKWLVLPFVLALMAEALLLAFAGTFGGAVGEMALKWPSAIWLAWHTPGLMLSLTLFGYDTLATVVIMFATGITQFVLIFWVMLVLAGWTMKAIQWISSQTRPTAVPGAAHKTVV